MSEPNKQNQKTIRIRMENQGGRPRKESASKPYTAEGAKSLSSVPEPAYHGHTDKQETKNLRSGNTPDPASSLSSQGAFGYSRAGYTNDRIYQEYLQARAGQDASSSHAYANPHASAGGNGSAMPGGMPSRIQVRPDGGSVSSAYPSSGNHPPHTGGEHAKNPYAENRFHVRNPEPSYSQLGRRPSSEGGSSRIYVRPQESRRGSSPNFPNSTESILSFVAAPAGSGTYPPNSSLTPSRHMRTEHEASPRLRTSDAKLQETLSRLRTDNEGAYASAYRLSSAPLQAVQTAGEYAQRGSSFMQPQESGQESAGMSASAVMQKASTTYRDAETLTRWIANTAGRATASPSLRSEYARRVQPIRDTSSSFRDASSPLRDTSSPLMQKASAYASIRKSEEAIAYASERVKTLSTTTIKTRDYSHLAAGMNQRIEKALSSHGVSVHSATAGTIHQYIQAGGVNGSAFSAGEQKLLSRFDEAVLSQARPGARLPSWTVASAERSQIMHKPLPQASRNASANFRGNINSASQIMQRAGIAPENARVSHIQKALHTGRLNGKPVSAADRGVLQTYSDSMGLSKMGKNEALPHLDNAQLSRFRQQALMAKKEASMTPQRGSQPVATKPVSGNATPATVAQLKHGSVGKSQRLTPREIQDLKIRSLTDSIASNQRQIVKATQRVGGLPENMVDPNRAVNKIFQKRGVDLSKLSQIELRQIMTTGTIGGRRLTVEELAKVRAFGKSQGLTYMTRQEYRNFRRMRDRIGNRGNIRFGKREWLGKQLRRAPGRLRQGVNASQKLVGTMQKYGDTQDSEPGSRYAKFRIPTLPGQKKDSLLPGKKGSLPKSSRAKVVNSGELKLTEKGIIDTSAKITKKGTMRTGKEGGAAFANKQLKKINNKKNVNLQRLRKGTKPGRAFSRSKASLGLSSKTGKLRLKNGKTVLKKRKGLRTLRRARFAANPTSLFKRMMKLGGGFFNWKKIVAQLGMMVIAAIIAFNMVLTLLNQYATAGSNNPVIAHYNILGQDLTGEKGVFEDQTFAEQWDERTRFVEERRYNTMYSGAYNSLSGYSESGEDQHEINKTISQYVVDHVYEYIKENLRKVETNNIKNFEIKNIESVTIDGVEVGAGFLDAMNYTDAFDFVGHHVYIGQRTSILSEGGEGWSSSFEVKKPDTYQTGNYDLNTLLRTSIAQHGSGNSFAKDFEKNPEKELFKTTGSKARYDAIANAALTITFNASSLNGQEKGSSSFSRVYYPLVQYSYVNGLPRKTNDAMPLQALGDKDTLSYKPLNMFAPVNVLADPASGGAVSLIQNPVSLTERPISLTTDPGAAIVREDANPFFIPFTRPWGIFSQVISMFVPKGSMPNFKVAGQIGSCAKDGYYLAGWAFEQNASKPDFTAYQELTELDFRILNSKAENGTVQLYAVYLPEGTPVTLGDISVITDQDISTEPQFFNENDRSLKYVYMDGYGGEQYKEADLEEKDSGDDDIAYLYNINTLLRSLLCMITCVIENTESIGDETKMTGIRWEGSDRQTSITARAMVEYCEALIDACLSSSENRMQIAFTTKELYNTFDDQSENWRSASELSQVIKAGDVKETRDFQIKANRAKYACMIKVKVDISLEHLMSIDQIGYIEGQQKNQDSEYIMEIEKEQPKEQTQTRYSNLPEEEEPPRILTRVYDKDGNRLMNTPFYERYFSTLPIFYRGDAMDYYSDEDNYNGYYERLGLKNEDGEYIISDDGDFEIVSNEEDFNYSFQGWDTTTEEGQKNYNYCNTYVHYDEQDFRDMFMVVFPSASEYGRMYNDTNIAQIFNYLVTRENYSVSAALGVVGNLMVECHTTDWSDIQGFYQGDGYGLARTTKEDLLDFDRQVNAVYSQEEDYQPSIITQLQYYLYLLGNAFHPESENQTFPDKVFGLVGWSMLDHYTLYYMNRNDEQVDGAGKNLDYHQYQITSTGRGKPATYLKDPALGQPLFLEDPDTYLSENYEDFRRLSDLERAARSLYTSFYVYYLGPPGEEPYGEQYSKLETNKLVEKRTDIAGTVMEAIDSDWGHVVGTITNPLMGIAYAFLPEGELAEAGAELQEEYQKRLSKATRVLNESVQDASWGIELRVAWANFFYDWVEIKKAGPSECAEKALEWAVEIANDDTHGYGCPTYAIGHPDTPHSTSNAGDPDYDCSSFVSHAYSDGAGHYLEFGANGAGGAEGIANTVAGFGFDKIPFSVEELVPGDILISLTGGHTEMYYEPEDGVPMSIGAHSDTSCSIGDVGGDEVCPVPLNPNNWAFILRCNQHDGGSRRNPTNLTGTMTNMISNPSKSASKVTAAAKETTEFYDKSAGDDDASLSADWIRKVLRVAGYPLTDEKIEKLREDTGNLTCSYVDPSIEPSERIKATGWYANDFWYYLGKYDSMEDDVSKELKPGMVISVLTTPREPTIYGQDGYCTGHAGIYLQNGLVMSYANHYVETIPLSEFQAKYGYHFKFGFTPGVGNNYGEFLFDIAAADPNYHGHTVALTEEQFRKICRSAFAEQEVDDFAHLVGFMQYIRDYVDFGHRSYDMLGAPKGTAGAWLIRGGIVDYKDMPISWYEEYHPAVVEAARYVFFEGGSMAQSREHMYYDDDDATGDGGPEPAHAWLSHVSCGMWPWAESVDAAYQASLSYGWDHNHTIIHMGVMGAPTEWTDFCFDGDNSTHSATGTVATGNEVPNIDELYPEIYGKPEDFHYYNEADYTDEAKAIIAAAEVTPSTSRGYCGAWVGLVLANAGVPNAVGKDGNQYWEEDCNFTEFEDLKPGMLIAVRNSTSDLGATYGHVGIYLGNDTVISSIGYIEYLSVHDWIQKYNNYGLGSYPRWGYYKH